MAETVYLNGSLLPRSQARVSVFDQGYLYGYGLFETMRAYQGKIFLLERHLKRLLDSAEVLDMASGLVGLDLGKACIDTLKANRLRDARLRLTVSRGEVASFPGTDYRITPTVLVTASGYTPFSARVYDKGFQVGISSLRRQSQSILSEIKSANYLLSVLAKIEAGKAGLDEALLLNDRGFIAEGSLSNVFFIDNFALLTPPVDSGILPGITRGVVIELASTLGVSVNEVDIKPEELARFDEAFLTNSMMELMPLVSVCDEADKRTVIGSGRPGEITHRLMNAYRELVEKEISGKDG